jgi:acyl-CoA thioester hydrolase
MCQIEVLVQPENVQPMYEPQRFDTPVIGPLMAVEDEWIDYNDHLNMAYYNLIFDRSSEAAINILNLGEAYRRAEDRTLVTAEAHVTFVREMKPGSTVRASFRLLDADAKSLHVYQELFHSDGWLSATSESLMLHVDLKAGKGGPKVVRFPPEITEDVQTMLRYHRSLPRTKYMGKVIGIRR